EFDATDFEPWPEADGQYVAYEVVTPLAVEPLDDLLALHADAAVDLRLTPRLGLLTDRMLASGLPFSFVRLRHALRWAPTAGNSASGSAPDRAPAGEAADGQQHQPDQGQPEDALDEPTDAKGECEEEEDDEYSHVPPVPAVPAA